MSLWLVADRGGAWNPGLRLGSRCEPAITRGYILPPASRLSVSRTSALALATWMVAAILLDCREAHAGFVVTIPHMTVAPGESGYMDVLISSNGMYSVQSYWLDFIVGGPQHAASPINFVESATPAPQLTNVGYIFLETAWRPTIHLELILSRTKSALQRPTI